MTFLIIITAVLLIILGLLFIPIRVDISYTDDFYFKASFLKITLYRSDKVKKEKPRKTDNGSPEKKPQPQKSTLDSIKTYFKQKKEADGFAAVIKEIMAVVDEVLSHIKWLLRFATVNKVRLNVTVGTDDAAKTAIEYGLVCNGIYPVTAFLDSVAHIGFKEINIRADFEGGKSDFDFKAVVKMQIFYILVSAFKIYKTLKKFVTEKIQNG